MANAFNTVTLIGYLPKTDKVKQTYYPKTEEKGAFFDSKISVRRSFKEKDSNTYKYDMLRIKAFGGSATLLGEYAKKGDMISVTGSIQVDDNYERPDGTIAYGQPFILVEGANIISSSNEASEDSGKATPAKVSVNPLSRRQ